MADPALTVAVVGGGPAGLYLADALFAQAEREVRVDVIDRLPTPFGLLRYGVAPDHLKMKALAVPLQHVLDDERVRFLGNVEVGRDVQVDELRERYSAVAYTFGASSDRHLGVPGEDLPGSTSAAELVRWYSGHPDATEPPAPLDTPSVAVVGAGNVALDVARILLKRVEDLDHTDVPQPVLDVLRDSPLRELHLLVRRGPAQVRFTSKELRELGELEGVDVVMPAGALELTEAEREEAAADRTTRQNLETFAAWAERSPTGAPRRLVLHFWTSPTALEGDGRVERVLVRANREVPGQAPDPVPAGLVVRCVGYHGVPVPGVPFDPDTGTVPNDEGRVLRDGTISPREYAAGWIRRGPTGVIGTNRSDARHVASCLLEDDPPDREPWDLAAELRARGVAVVTTAGWSRIDAAEVALGGTQGRPRTKLADWDSLLAAAARS